MTHSRTTSRTLASTHSLSKRAAQSIRSETEEGTCPLPAAHDGVSDPSVVRPAATLSTEASANRGHSRIHIHTRRGSDSHSSQKSMVDAAGAVCRTYGHDISGDGRGYARVERSRLITSAEISEMFGKPSGWFGRDRVRKALDARGFPSRVVAGRWLRTAVEAWLEREGRRNGSAPNHRSMARADKDLKC